MALRALVPLLLCVLTLGGCASSDGFVSSWKAPDAKALNLRNAKVAAVVMMDGEATRRPAEEALAREITARGAQGIPMYTLLSGASPSDEAAARAACENAGVQGVVAIKPTAVDKKITAEDVTYLSPTYTGYWGDYYGYGWGTSYAPVTAGQSIYADTVVTIETRVYSLKQNKLVWVGKSKTTNPSNIDDEVRKLAAMTARQLEKEGLLDRGPAAPGQP
jgi:hypothetical protein